MKLKYSVSAAMAAAALTFGVSGAQAQYTIMSPVAGGSATMLPYGGYYGPAISAAPIISYGAPYFYQPSAFSFGNFGYEDVGTGLGFGPVGPGVFNNVGDVNTAAGGRSSVQSVNGTVVQGGIVDPTQPEVAQPYAVPPAAGNETVDPATAAANAQNAARAYRAAVANLVTARRAPYNRIALSYNGSTAGVTSVTLMLLDSHRRELQQAVLTDPPAQTLLRRPVGARYYRVVLDYANGTQRTITKPLISR